MTDELTTCIDACLLIQHGLEHLGEDERAGQCLTVLAGHIEHLGRMREYAFAHETAPRVVKKPRVKVKAEPAIFVLHDSDHLLPA
jgi:hypothetical protein